MTDSAANRIVLLGMMSRMPVAGNVWLILQYMIGLRRLGYDPYYVEAHGVYPGMLVGTSGADSLDPVSAFLDGMLRPYGFGDRWAFHDVHSGRCRGLDLAQLNALYRSAALVVNVHGGTMPLPEHYATGRLVYLGTDPVQVEVELHDGNQATIDFMAPHSSFFTWGENYGRSDCLVPWSEQFHFLPTRAPVVLDLWDGGPPPAAGRFTTIGNWNQSRQSKDVTLGGVVYTWSKHHEFLKFLDLPARTGQAFELALSRGSFTPADREMLEGRGWEVRDSLEFSSDLGEYRRYIAGSRGEFTVAKDQNVRLRSGWFSERSAQYLASGRPVITQETGFSNILPTGRGLFAFATLDEAAAAVTEVNGAYAAHCRAARDIAREFFSYDVVLPKFLAEAGVDARPRGRVVAVAGGGAA